MAAISVGSIDTVVEPTGVAEVLALRVPAPERGGGRTAVGALSTCVADPTWSCGYRGGGGGGGLRWLKGDYPI